MTNYSAAEEASAFNLIFPFLQAKSPVNAVNIKDQLGNDPTNGEDFNIQPCMVRLQKLKWIGGSKLNEKTKTKTRKPKKWDRGPIVKYLCSSCDFQSLYRYSVKKHQEQDHKKQQCRVLMIGCVKCQEGQEHKRCGNNNGRNRGRNKSKDDRFLCNSCDYKSHYRQSVTSHQKLSHKDEGQVNKVLKIGCQNCEQNVSHKRCGSHHNENLRGKVKSRKGGNYKCDECEFSTVLEESLLNHVQHHHLKIVRYSCSACGFKHFHRPAVISHQRDRCSGGDSARVLQIGCQPCEENQEHQHHNRNRLKKKDWNIRCDYRLCDYRTVKQKWLEAHIQRVHVSKKTFSCPDCSYETFFKSALLRHCGNVHGGEQKSVRRISRGARPIIRTRKNYQVKCPTCPFKTCSLELLEAHRERVHVRKLRLACSSPGCSYRSYYRQSLYRHWRSLHPAETLSLLWSRCDLCDEDVEHEECQGKLEERSDKRGHPCSECPYNSSSKVDLAKHFRTDHPQQTQFLCDNCPYVSNYQHNLKTHISSKHQENKLVCDKCDFVSSWRTAFLQHQREKHGEFKKRSKHSDQRMYLCENCSFSTKIPKLFYSHQSKHRK